MTGHGEKHKRIMQLLGLGGLVWLALVWPAWGDDIDTWRQAWCDYEREIRAWCTKWSPTSPELCMQQEMAKHDVSPAFFTNLCQPREEPKHRAPDRDKKDPDAVYFVIAVVIFCGWLVFSILRSHLRTWRETKARETMPCQHGVTGAGHDPTKCSACVRADQQRRDAARRQAQAEQERREAEQAQQYAAWVACIRLPEYLQSMDPKGFERLVCELFRRLGYEVEATPYSGDSGVDGYLRKNGMLSILQCKRVQGSVGEPVLRDLFGTMQHAKATWGIVVTTGRVSKQARRWVQGKPIHIVELAELCRLLDEHFAEHDIVPATFKPSGRHDTLCPRCEKPLRVVNGRRGRFIGGTGYPKCRYTRSVW